MQTIPSDILVQFSAVLEKRAVPVSLHRDSLKWLRYYLDFRSRYTLPDSKSEHCVPSRTVKEAKSPLDF